jgi:hypothetical protein
MLHRGKKIYSQDAACICPEWLPVRLMKIWWRIDLYIIGDFVGYING